MVVARLLAKVVKKDKEKRGEGLDQVKADVLMLEFFIIRVPATLLVVSVSGKIFDFDK